jgi:hypothetical protein
MCFASYKLLMKGDTNLNDLRTNYPKTLCELIIIFGVDGVLTNTKITPEQIETLRVWPTNNFKILKSKTLFSC